MQGQSRLLWFWREELVDLSFPSAPQRHGGCLRHLFVPLAYPAMGGRSWLLLQRECEGKITCLL